VFRQDALAAVGGDDRAGLRDGPVAHVAGQPSRRRRDDALLDAIPDAAGLALQRPGQLGDLHHGPEIGGDRGLGVLELPVVIEESGPEHLVERVEVVVAPGTAGTGGTLMSKLEFTGTQSNQGNSNGANRGHEFTVQPMAESFGWQGQAR
jgi:hypothetical protein